MNIADRFTETADVIMVQWQAAVDHKHYVISGFTHISDKVHYHIGEKYARFDVGGSGAFMVEIETGTVYGIMGYGKVDKKKNSGNIYDRGFDAEVLVRDRFRRGRFTNLPDGTPYVNKTNLMALLKAAHA